MTGTEDGARLMSPKVDDLRRCGSLTPSVERIYEKRKNEDTTCGHRLVCASYGTRNSDLPMTVVTMRISFEPLDKLEPDCWVELSGPDVSVLGNGEAVMTGPQLIVVLEAVAAAEDELELVTSLTAAEVNERRWPEVSTLLSLLDNGVGDELMKSVSAVLIDGTDEVIFSNVEPGIDVGMLSVLVSRRSEEMLAGSLS